MKFSFLNTPKPRQYNYQPVFYDEAAERRKERERKIREELGMPPMKGDENRSAEERLRGKLTDRSNRNITFTRKARRVSNIRIIVIAAILFLLAYLVFGSGLERFFSLFQF